MDVIRGRCTRWALLCALVVVEACRATPGDRPSPSASEAVEVLFQDPFDGDANRWRALTPAADATIVDGAYSWVIPPGDQVVLAVPGVLRGRGGELDRVRVRVDVRLEAGAARVGIACRVSGAADAGEMYVLSTRLPDVDAHRITRLDADGRSELAQTEPDPQEVPDISSSHVLEADCVSGRDGLRATLTVDGRRVLRARDPRPLAAGVVGLWAASPPAEFATGDAEVEFDDFTVERR